ncbi:MAG: hypothetical protein AAB336_03215 [Acidobacteriota bacterium]
MSESDKNIVPKKQSLFPLSAEDIVDNALQNLDETQARKVTEKAADEIVRIAVEKRKAEHRTALAQDEMRNLIDNANLLDKSVADYKINSTFETASGTTNVEIRKAKMPNINVLAIIISVVILIILIIFLLKN